MRSLVGLAELARFAARLSRDEAREAARMLGYAPSELGTRPQVEAPAPAEPTPQERFEAAVASVDAREPTAAFWRVERYEPLPDAEALPTFASTLTDPLLPEERGGRLFDTPEAPALTPWRHLWPALHEALRTEHPGRELDTAALVRRWTRGEPVSRLPRVTRRAWAASASVWIDRSARLIPLWRDQERVVKGLRRVMGRSLRVQRLDESAAQLRRSPRAWIARQQLDETTPVVVLGDLGAFGEDGETWRGAVDSLRGVGVRVTAFVPWSVRHHPHRVSSAFNAVSWERGAAARPSDETLVSRLLTLVAAAAFVQPGMLRALRWLLPGVDVETELSVWNHAAVNARDATGLVLRASEARAWQARFGALDDALQKRVSEVIAKWHGGLPRELLYGETLAWTEIARVKAPTDVGAARAFAKRFAGVLASGSAADPRAWRHYGRAVMAAMPPSAVKENPALAVVWDIAHEGLDDAVPPEGVDIAAVRAKRRQGTAAQAWSLRQVGDALVASPRDDARWPSDVTGPGSPVAVVTTVGPELLVAQGATRAQRVIDAGVELPLGASSVLALTDARGTHQLVTWQREGWMSRVERDRFGLWAEVEVKSARFRMRWIPPGRFVMGSPEGEAGRYDDELQHEVVLTRGYWLGETPVTQALWEAVMGANPSRFKSADRPVETVSWDDSMEFVTRLNGLAPGLDVGLPTEAEWEHACRAGTKTATWAGDLTITKENRAKELDAIAWYYGNSGETTHSVREKSANPWGMYDMLGNVLEWCSDWHAPYDATPAVDPRGAESGTERVLRGGSWNDYARLVRAAQRLAYVPGYAFDDFGLRLARGQSALQGAGEKRGTTGGRRRMP